MTSQAIEQNSTALCLGLLFTWELASVNGGQAFIQLSEAPEPQAKIVPG